MDPLGSTQPPPMWLRPGVGFHLRRSASCAGTWCSTGRSAAWPWPAELVSQAWIDQARLQRVRRSSQADDGNVSGL